MGILAPTKQTWYDADTIDLSIVPLSRFHYVQHKQQQQQQKAF
jgi:hypothetical protein